MEIEHNVMPVNTKQSVYTSCFPPDGDDVCDFVLTSSNMSVLEVESNNVLNAKNAGIVTISFGNNELICAENVTVLPDIMEIKLTHKYIELFVGQSQRIGATLIPEEVYDSRHEWISSDSSVASVARLQDGNLYVVTKGIGECYITCRAIRGNAQSVCHVKVKSTFEMNRKKSVFDRFFS